MEQGVQSSHQSVESVNAVWIKDMVAKGDSSIELMGYTLYRQRIPRIANMFANATLQTVDLENIRGKDVYKFILTIKNVEEDK
jgi:hypothetical protein